VSAPISNNMALQDDNAAAGRGGGGASTTVVSEDPEYEREEGARVCVCGGGWVTTDNNKCIRDTSVLTPSFFLLHYLSPF